MNIQELSPSNFMLKKQLTKWKAKINIEKVFLSMGIEIGGITE